MCGPCTLSPSSFAVILMGKRVCRYTLIVFRGLELQCLLKVKEELVKNFFKLIKIKIVSFFSENHIDIFDHKYRVDSGNLFSIKYSMLEYQYIT